ncbi:MAG: RNA-guided endonuclease TnpB family protein [bacterium]
MLSATRIRLYPNATQQLALARQFGCARWAWNDALSETQRLYQETGKGLGYEAMTRRLPLHKQEHEWLREANAQVLQQSLRNLSRAFINFFERRGRYPRFKRRNGPQSIQFPQGVKVTDKRVFLPKVGWFKAVVHRSIEGEIKTVTVRREPCGHYYASVLVDDREPMPVVSLDGPVVGVDVGLKDFAVTSDGEHVANPRHLQRAERNLVRKQRKMERKVKGSNGRDKARKLVARAHERVKNARRDFVNKVSRRLVDENQVIAVEDLGVKGMMRNPNLAKAIGDVGWGMFGRMAEYKAAWAGKGFVRVNRFYPSSKACNACGAINDRLTLAVRAWTCSACGSSHDRDENAARNIRDEAKRMIWAGVIPASASGTGAAAVGGIARRVRGRRSSVAQIPEKAEAGAFTR